MTDTWKNFGFVRKSGILMSVSSLPSEYGIGGFGEEARAFVDFLKAAGQTCWQVLPLNPTAYGDSPYQSPASAAGNPYFIDIKQLCKDGLLTQNELDSAKMPQGRVDYGALYQSRYPLLRLAHSRFVPNRAYEDFCLEKASWLEDYALFMALKAHYGFSQWTTWQPQHRDVKLARKTAGDFAGERDFWKWVQFAFFTQWEALRQYAHENGILLIGDMPLYVAHDSMDLWRNPEQFLLDEKGEPTFVAGFPPDDFSPDGQLWGNPLYNWAYMEKESFSWWIARLKNAASMYDILRLDHFIGFANFYAVPYPAANARKGKWVRTPGKKFFAQVKKELPQLKVIAEDLGLITDVVRRLMAYTGFPGMKNLQFAFFDEDSENLPRTYETDNCVAYTGSHDADCTKSWYENLGEEAKKRFQEEKPAALESPVWEMIGFAMDSRANLAMVPMQDYLELTNEEGRMNVPSVATGNWNWRAAPDYADKALADKIRSMTTRFGRL